MTRCSNGSTANMISKITNLHTILTTCLLLALVGFAGRDAQAAQTDIAGPSGSGTFGQTVTVLPNGNIVVTDPGYSIPGGAASAGAVYLYDGTTLAPISTVTGSTASDNIGSGGVTVLTNGNYVVSSPNWDNGAVRNAGAVTFGSGTAGVSGTVSANNSLVGSLTDDKVGSGGVTALTNGNYVVRSIVWDNGSIADAGAVTFGSGTTGVSGAVSAANSLVGAAPSDQVGSGGVTALMNGNYVVSSLNWTNGAIKNAGAATFGSGTIGISGTISAVNSLVGSTLNDQVGEKINVLTNGNYVIGSGHWDNGLRVDAGAATFGSGATGVSGTISAANSLVGSLSGDIVGIDGITALTNGNYVVRNPSWDNGVTPNVGAATFGNGGTGVSGTISAANSLIGSKTNDQVGLTGIVALTNGNYVVASGVWSNGTLTNAGAVTFGNGATGISGTVSPANSLVGIKMNDSVGAVKALTNGNYVVISQYWDNDGAPDAGAVTFASGTTGIIGSISAANSLIGTQADDEVGSGGITALPSGNYVVSSPNWYNGTVGAAGAATFGSGVTGIAGLISAANSLVGSTQSDLVSGGGVTLLTNGNYVVKSPNWDNGSTADAGAATFGSGTNGIAGVISAGNSLAGTRASDKISSGGVTALTNGNYVVDSPGWNNGSLTGAGAATFGSGTTGISGTISAVNSLVGSKLNDSVGDAGVTALTNGNYVVKSTLWDNGVFVNEGATTFGNGASGTAGAITGGASGGNSVVGTRTNAVSTFAFDATRNRLFVGNTFSDTVSILFFNTTATSDGAINSAATFDNGLPGGLVNAIIPNGRTVSLSGISNIGQVSVDCTGALTGASASNYIVGSVRRNYCAAAGSSFIYPVGDANNYSPLTASNVKGTGALTVSVVDDTLPGLPAMQSVSRYWQLDGSGLSTNLTFQYTAVDISGIESTYKVNRRLGTNNLPYPTTIDTAAHTAAVENVTSFSPWGIGNITAAFLPTAAGVSISGKAKTADGKGLVNATVMLTTEDGRTLSARTSVFGLFHFDGLKAGQTVIVSVEAKRYVFAPQLISLTGELGSLELIAVN